MQQEAFFRTFLVVLSILIWIPIAVVIYVVLAVRSARAVRKKTSVRELRAIQDAWRAPPELSSAPPRAVRLLTREVLGGLALMLSIWVLFSAFYLLPVLREFHAIQKVKSLEHGGVEGQAEVVRKRTVRGKSGSYSAVYRFKVAGNVYQRRAVLSRYAYYSVWAGDRVAVRYLASDPSVSRLPMEEPQPLLAVLLDKTGNSIGIVVSLWAVSFLLAGVCWRQASVQNRLLRWGQPVAALVTHLTPRFSARVPGQKAHYQFLDLSGNPGYGNAIVGSRTYGRFFSPPSDHPLYGDPPAQGATITVLYDPQKPRRNMIYPLLGGAAWVEIIASGAALRREGKRAGFHFRRTMTGIRDDCLSVLYAAIFFAFVAAIAEIKPVLRGESPTVLLFVSAGAAALVLLLGGLWVITRAIKPSRKAKTWTRKT